MPSTTVVDGAIPIGTSATCPKFFPFHLDSTSALHEKPRSELLNRPQFLLPQDTSMSSMASALFARAARPVSCTACRTVACPSVLGSAANFTSSQRGYSTSTEPTSDVQKPRWSYTPPRAKAPFSLRYNSKRAAFPVNEDPKRLDQFYIRMLGEDGDKMLSEEVKWLAVTHKSFDQGRRGFNDRLAFVGACNQPPEESLLCLSRPGINSNVFLLGI